MSTSKRIDDVWERVEHLLERSTPARMTLTLANGEVVNTDPCGVIRAFQELALGQIVDVTTDRADYAELAGVLSARCW